MHPNLNRAGLRPTARKTTCRLGAAALLLAAGTSGAALIEIPAAQLDRDLADGRHTAMSWQESTRHARLAAGAMTPLSGHFSQYHAGHATGLAKVGNADAKPRAGTAAPAVQPGLYAALDAPFGALDTTAPLAAESESEIWTLLLVGAGLIAYQLRRKSRMGSIRFRPL
jgi:hypothetical protein